MIYYPSSAGGGMKELFRKVGNRSSEFHPKVRRVRREGSYIYEEFMPTGGTDVKVYTVSPEYAHAEARKSPVVDGVVMRNPDGKEVREANQMVEEFMLAANVSVAKQIRDCFPSCSLLRLSMENSSVVAISLTLTLLLFDTRPCLPDINFWFRRHSTCNTPNPAHTL